MEDGRANSIHEKYAKAFEMPTRGDRKKGWQTVQNSKRMRHFNTHTNTHSYTHSSTNTDTMSDFRFDDKYKTVELRIC